MYTELNFDENNLIINYLETNEHADIIKSLISNKFKFNELVLKEGTADDFLKIYERERKKYNNIIIIGTTEVKNNTLCILKITLDEKTNIYNEQTFDYELDEFCKLLNTI
jgi:hypothetical protein